MPDHATPAPRAAVAPLAPLRFSGSAGVLATDRDDRIVVCVPTVDEQRTIGDVCLELVGLRDAGAIDRVLVCDNSTDATPFIAEAAGAEVVRQGDLMSDFGAVRGKGDAMWRALAAVDEDVVVFVDGDTHGFRRHMAGDLAAAVAVEGYSFVKATYQRPFDTGHEVLPTGGGRVTELAAKPLLGALLPPLAAFDQPLAGEIAVRTDLLRALPFVTGYGVDVALLIDAWRMVGLEQMAQVDTGLRQNRHRPLAQLGPMADEVSRAILNRAGVETSGAAPATERPPMDAVPGAALDRIAEAA
jgi:glucosyl-3-phosphoglycerate synthase